MSEFIAISPSTLDYSLCFIQPSISHDETNMASGPITSWQIDRERVETVTDFIFLGSKIMADGDWSHEIERCLLLEEKFNQPRQLIKKPRHYFANKGLSSV